MTEHEKDPPLEPVEIEAPEHDGETPSPLESLRDQLPRTPEELSTLVRNIVSDVMHDIEEQKRQLEASRSNPLRRLRNLRWRDVRALDLPFTMRQVLGGTAAFLALTATAITIQLWPEHVDLPQEMLGVWTTNDPRYADRGFRLTPTTLTIYTAADDSTFHQIKYVEHREDPIASLYVITYLWYNEEYEMGFYFVPTPNEVIRLRNQRDMAWRKGGRAPAGADSAATVTPVTMRP